ncbi:aromatic-L-amino-acid decarboxylase-like isoform X2 [Littorina saxatilis]|uniref:Aromatic-L-amino-acid decarboxylase n=2 Tax=Littorina saxatilis TaxID=31220 RepID=A0AAN9B4W1_9CAEN
MDSKQFREVGKQMIDYIADYHDNIRQRSVKHNVSPGYLLPLLPDSAPEDPERWEDIFKDIEKVIMPGVMHWRSPRFHGYFAVGGSYPSILGDMLGDAIGCIGFSWASGPACTELEMVTTDWLGKMMGLPEHFLHSHSGLGGGVIQTTASETVLLCVLAARNRMVARMKETDPDMNHHSVISRFVCYSSDQANSSVHRSGLLADVRMRKLQSDDNFSLRGETLRKAIEEDKAKGLIPFFICATLGTTGCCAFDSIKEIGPLCEKEGIWLHIDAAYAGSAFVCPEYREHLEGVEYAETFSTNPHKWMLCNYDLSVMWIKNREYLVDAFNVDPFYLKHQNEGRVPDFRHWQIPLGRRFRALKLWFVLRCYGVKGIQQYIRTHVSLAEELEALLVKDGRFEMHVPATMALVCFRLKGTNKLSEMLHDHIMARGDIYIIPDYARAQGKGVYFIRVAMVSEYMTSDDIEVTFRAIQRSADCVQERYADLLQTEKNGVKDDYMPLINNDACPADFKK